MSGNENDFDSDDFDLEGFDDGFDESKGTLADLWRNNAFVKIGTILLGIALLIGIFMIFGGEKEKKARSEMMGGQVLTETPGGEEKVPETITQAIEDVNTRRLESALRENESAVPIPTNTTKGRIVLDAVKQEEEDPLERWRRMQEEKLENAAAEPKNVVEPTEPVVDVKTPAIDALSTEMLRQMESILSNQKINGAQVQEIADMSYLESLQEKEKELRKKEKEDRERNRNNDENVSDDASTIILPAGSIEYAQLLTEANTDVPGPILAQIVTGPLKGARVIGTFEETYNFLTLNFDTIIIDGIDYSVEAVAINPDTTLPGVVSDIDRRYFTRVVLPVAAEFISGFSSAIAESGKTTVIISGDTVTETTTNENSKDQEVALGISAAGEELSGIINEYKDNHPQLLRVRAGTPIGLLFVDSVTDEESDDKPTVLENFQSGGAQNENE